MTEQETIISFNKSIKSIVDIFLLSKTPFFLTIDPNIGWIPPLPDELCGSDALLFNIDGDAFSDCKIEPTYTEIFVAIQNDTSGYVLHRYKIDESNRVKRILESTDGQPSSVILCKPSYMFEYIEETDRYHSIDHFLTNPNNAKFFK